MFNLCPDVVLYTYAGDYPAFPNGTVPMPPIFSLENLKFSPRKSISVVRLLQIGVADLSPR